VGVTISEQT